MDPFYGWGSTVSILGPLRGGSLLLTTIFASLKHKLVNHFFFSKIVYVMKDSFHNAQTNS